MVKCCGCLNDKPSIYHDSCSTEHSGFVVIDLCFGCAFDLGFIEIEFIGQTQICDCCGSRFIPLNESVICSDCYHRNRKKVWRLKKWGKQ